MTTEFFDEDDKGGVHGSGITPGESPHNQPYYAEGQQPTREGQVQAQAGLPGQQMNNYPPGCPLPPVPPPPQHSRCWACWASGPTWIRC